MKIVAIDYGTRRIGVAFGEDGKVSEAKKVSVKNENEARLKLADIISGDKPQAVIFGLPLRLDGSEKEEAAKVRQFAMGLSQSTGVPVVFIDERLSSIDAATLMREQGLPEGEIREKVDQGVARLLLEQYYREQH